MGKAKAGTPALDVEVVPIGSLTLDPRNARKHGRRNLEAIKGSLEQFGQRRPLVVRADLQVIAGNGTLEAMQELRFTEVAITRVPAGWTDEQVRAYALADNRTAELAEWDDVVLADMLAELDAGGWDLNSIGFDGLSEIAPGDSDDEAPDAGEVTPTAKLGDLWELGEHRVVCGSSTDLDAVAALFGDRVCDLVLTDPPYGVDYVANKDKTASIRGQTAGKHRNISNDALSSAALLELLQNALGLAFVHARDGAPCYVFHSDARRMEFEGAMLACGWHVAQNLVWVKDNFVLGMMDYHSQHEPVLYGWKPGGRHSWYGARKRSALVADQQPDLDTLDRDELVALLREFYDASDVIRHDRPRRSDAHPTMKPVGLLSRLIVNSTKKRGGGLRSVPRVGLDPHSLRAPGARLLRRRARPHLRRRRRAAVGNGDGPEGEARVVSRRRRSVSTVAAAQRRYRRAIFTVLEQRGEVCESCGDPARHVHHIITVATSGIDDELAYEPANMMVLCNECHALMHPGSKNRNMWWRMAEAGRSRGHALNRVSR